MKEKIIKILINGVIGMATAIATTYLGASAVEAVGASGVVAGTIGGRASDVVLAVVSQVA